MSMPNTMQMVKIHQQQKEKKRIRETRNYKSNVS